MTLQEMQKMDRWEVIYCLLLSNMTLYKMTLDKISLMRRKNVKGRYLSDFVFYLHDNSDNTHVYKYRVFDDEYLWLCTALSNDFPDIELIDLTDEQYKVVKDV